MTKCQISIGWIGLGSDGLNWVGNPLHYSQFASDFLESKSWFLWAYVDRGLEEERSLLLRNHQRERD